MIRNGSDVWVWESKENTGTHFKLPAGATGVRATSFNGAYGSTAQDAEVVIGGRLGDGEAGSVR